MPLHVDLVILAERKNLTANLASEIFCSVFLSSVNLESLVVSERLAALVTRIQLLLEVNGASVHPQVGIRSKGLRAERAPEVPDLQVNFLIMSIGAAFRSETFVADDALVLLLVRVN